MDTHQNNDDEYIDIENLESVIPLPKIKKKSRWFLNPYPFQRQYDEVECGPACLSMISEFYGNKIPIRVWRENMDLNQEGTSLFDLSISANKFGFETLALEVEDLCRLPASRLPVIALMENHFVVVYEVNDRWVTVADPAIELKKLSRDEFDSKFTGMILILSPNDNFLSVTNTKAEYLHFFSFFSGHTGSLLIIFMAGIVATTLSTIPAFLTQYILDTVLQSKNQSSLVYVILIAFSISSFLNLNQWIKSYFIAFLCSKFDFSSKSSLMHKLLSLKFKFFASRHVGDFLNRMNETQKFRDFVITELLGSVFSLASLLFYGFVLFSYSSTIATFVFLTSPILVLFSVFTSKKMIIYYNQSFAAASEQDSIVTEHFRGIATIKTLGAEKATRKKFEMASLKSIKAGFNAHFYSSTVSLVTSLLSSMIDLSVIGMAAYLAIIGGLTPGQVVSVSLIAASVVGPFESISNLWSGLVELKASMDRLNDVFLAESEKQDGVIPNSSETSTEIEFENVWYRYGGESSEWVIKNLSFKINSGERVSIVGRSGSGKSTIALLAARLLEPTQGTIYIDGIDYKTLSLEYIRKRVGVLLQTTHLFQGSIGENIAWSDSDPDFDRVSLSAEVSAASEFINEKHLGYDYKITHGGEGLSGGQKQRIGIARLIYRKPKLIILDEATSSLDQISEKKILSSFKEATQGCTIISIAHRYETIRNSDYCLVMSAGELIEKGSDIQLIEKKGAYYQLFHAEENGTTS